MNNSLEPIIFLALMIFAVWFWYYYETKAKEKVKTNLESKGYTDINVTRVWEIGKREIIYDVKYRNSQGVMNANSCIVSAGFFTPGDVYWKNPV